MSTMSERSHKVFVSVVLFLILNLQTCCGKYDCYQLSGKDICFMFDGIKRTFEESKQFCRNNGGFLLEIHNNETQQMVQHFGNDKKFSFVEVWLNLVRTNSNMWVWGGDGSGNFSTYSNWEVDNPAVNGINNAFMNSNYKWKNTYEPQQPSTICIEESGASIAYPIGTPSSVALYEVLYGAVEDSSTINNMITPGSTTNSTSVTTTNTSIQESSISLSYPNETPAITTTLENATSTISSNSILTSTTSTTKTTISWSLPSSATTTTTSMQPTYATPAHSDSSSSAEAAAVIGIGVGVGLGGLVLIIVSSLLVAKFVFHKEIPCSFKSSRNRKSPPHETGSDIIKDSYVQMNEKKLHKRSPYAEVVMSDTPNSPPNSTLTYISFKDLIQPNSASGLEGLSKTDYGTLST